MWALCKAGDNLRCCNMTLDYTGLSSVFLMKLHNLSKFQKLSLSEIVIVLVNIFENELLCQLEKYYCICNVVHLLVKK